MRVRNDSAADIVIVADVVENVGDTGGGGEPADRAAHAAEDEDDAAPAFALELDARGRSAVAILSGFLSGCCWAKRSLGATTPAISRRTGLPTRSAFTLEGKLAGNASSTRRASFESIRFVMPATAFCS